jgi:flagellar biosynthesis/type III secretory pathway chaperone
MNEKKEDINKSIDDFLSRSSPKPSDNGIVIKIGFAVFIALISAFLVHDAYEDYKMKKSAEAIIRSAKYLMNDLDKIDARNQQKLIALNLENQRKISELKAKNEAKAREFQRKQYLNNYWKDIGSGTFINVGSAQRNGDLATVLIKVNNRQQSISVNCNNNTYWSTENNSWVSALDSFTLEYELIKIACSANN